MGKNTTKNIAIVLVSGLIFGSVFYLTPLKHVNVVEPKINDVSPADFYEEYQQNPDGFIFIDVRSPRAYNDFHAEGLINMPLHTLFDQRKNLPKRGKEIILICSGGRASGVGYSYLEHHGFLNLKRIDGGIEAWHGTGLPVVFGGNGE